MPTLPELSDLRIAVVGLGYVGLPLAIEFARCHKCCRTGSVLSRTIIGFDINKDRLNELRSGHDRTLEVLPEELGDLDNIIYTDSVDDLSRADVFIVTVPTPIDELNNPDLSLLKKASATIAKALLKRKELNPDSQPLVIYESTVYPGVTEDVCVPVIEAESQLKLNLDFFCGYSPERINPGDKSRRIASIIKVTSGSTIDASLWIDNFYASIISAGTHLAPSIKVAEAAKVIENTQRDLNIALINELSIIFSRMKIDTLDVLEAAGTKWNFLPFRPGLVGGHCIGVDPYYLTYQSQKLGYYPQVVLAGRRINDGMSSWIAQKCILSMAKNGISILAARVLIMGVTFKENCPDIRNTKIVDLFREFEEYGINPDMHDPLADPLEFMNEYNIQLLRDLPVEPYDLVIVAVAHQEFLAFTSHRWNALRRPGGLIFDLKGILPRDLNPVRV